MWLMPTKNAYKDLKMSELSQINKLQSEQDVDR